ncbi:hypothetical protein TWF694_007789 [Orbilia ellipsospora]|uniref:Uncharacterized protein n=1 Tax=Orbilia ellipsospora TaxID=2528407 RepID=A0AAV9XIV7_9PEZI
MSVHDDSSIHLLQDMHPGILAITAWFTYSPLSLTPESLQSHGFETIRALFSVFGFLYDSYYYIAYAVAIFAVIDKIISVRRGERNPESQRRKRQRLLLHAISQWCLSQHFLQFLIRWEVEVAVEKALWMASQTLIAQAILIYTVGMRGKSYPRPIWRWLRRDDEADSKRPWFDWKSVALLIQQAAFAGTWMGNAVAEATWCILHTAIACDILREIYTCRLTGQEEQITIMVTCEDAPNVSEKMSGSEKQLMESISVKHIAVRSPKNRYLTLCAFLLFLEGVLQTSFFAYEKLFLSAVQAFDYDLATAALVGLHFGVKELLGIMLSLMLMIPDLAATVSQHLHDR